MNAFWLSVNNVYLYILSPVDCMEKDKESTSAEGSYITSLFTSLQRAFFKKLVFYCTGCKYKMQKNL